MTAFGVGLLDSRIIGFSQKCVSSADIVIYCQESELYGIFQAKKAFAEHDLVCVVDGCTVFIFLALNGFPGPFVKLLLNSFSYPGIIKLMKGEADRRAIFSFAVGYFDGEKDHIFVANEEGFIVDEPRGYILHGCTDLFCIY
ncbi:hypothetical protein KOY49_02310 [Candidatus Minimicrobia vallesae]|uniref:Uncharacterized protein n=1 Tax=Candidatus Minimicrobia vallesae TaxID=2841264 RepID=A0A8F1SBA1_9BACT|nr:non-canonical purine NTP pyrophosphatase [Candidatus Minimicrobia vallesae]QWQ31799.1 hypothetical protein KOY49_02310 [Candidatus Minimicrobia vallesae]